MGKELITFDNIEVQKPKFHQHKSPTSIYDVNVDRIVLSSRVPFGKKGFKYFIGYEDDSEKKYVLVCNASKNESM